MADQVTVDNGALTDFIVSTDDAGASGQIQRVKLAYSADGVATHVTADSSGLLVNLGSNNDVTITSGTVTVGGTATTSLAGTASVAVTSIAAGTAVIGRSIISTAGGTADATLFSLTSATAIAVGISDSTGALLPFAAPTQLGGTITNGTAVYASGDTMGTVVTFSSATVASNASGHAIKAICFDPSDQGQDINLWLFDSSVVPSADNAAFSLSDADLIKTVGVVQFTDWFDATNGQLSFGVLQPTGLPLPYHTSGSTNLYGVAQSMGTGTYATATVSFELHVVKD